MSWIQDMLKPKFQSAVSAAVESKPVQTRLDIPKSKREWMMLAEILTSDIAEFNSEVGTAHQVRHNDSLIEIISSPGIDTVVLTKDQEANSFHVVCTISRPGIPRHGHFRISNGYVVSTGDFVGEPAVGTLPMTMERFSEVVLKPYLFPMR
jgi:hypothetical protein